MDTLTQFRRKTNISPSVQNDPVYPVLEQSQVTDPTVLTHWPRTHGFCPLKHSFTSKADFFRGSKTNFESNTTHTIVLCE